METEAPIEAPPSPSREPSSEPVKRWAGHLLKLALAFLGIYLTWRLVAGIDWADLSRRVAGASWMLLALAAALLLARYSLWDLRFRLAARRVVERRTGPAFGFFVLMASAALNLITPSARLIGGLMRARYFAYAVTRPFGMMYGVVLYDQVAHHVVMSTCTCLAMVAAAFALGRTALGLGALAVLVAAAVAAVVWSRRQGTGENPLVRFLARRAEQAEGRSQRLYSHGHEAVGVFVRLLSDVPLRGHAALLGTGFFILNVLAQWLVFLALGQRVDPMVTLIGVSLGAAAGMLTGTPGGIGTTEAAMVASFTALGLDPVDAAAGSLLFRGLHYAGVLAVGLPALAVLEIKLSAKKVEAAPEP